MPTFFGSATKILRDLELSNDWDAQEQADEWFCAANDAYFEPPAAAEADVNSQQSGNDALLVVQRRLETAKLSDQCSICFDDDCRLLTLDCEHRFCVECLRNFVHNQVGDVHNLVHRVAVARHVNEREMLLCYENRATVRCPAFRCEHLLSRATLQHVAAPQDLQRIDHLANQRIEELWQIESMQSKRQQQQESGMKQDRNGTRLCPYCMRYAVLPIARKGPGAPRLRCRSCYTPFCGLCEDDHPRNERCDGTLLSMPAMANAKNQRRAFLKWLSTNATSNSVYGCNGIRACPHCYTVIEKNGGCPNMYCTRCRKAFVWTTAPRISIRRRVVVAGNRKLRV